MAIIVDANIILATILNEPHRDRLLQITAGHELVSPASLDWEIGNAMSAMFKKKRLTLIQAQDAMRLYRRIEIRRVEISIENAIEISHDQNIYAYDAFMIEAAKSTGFSLLTLDIRLKAAAQSAGVQCIEVLP